MKTETTSLRNLIINIVQLHAPKLIFKTGFERLRNIFKQDFI